LLQQILQRSNNFWATIANLTTAAATVAANMTIISVARITLAATTITTIIAATIARISAATLLQQLLQQLHLQLLQQLLHIKLSITNK